MLASLNIRNFVIVEKLDLEFYPGFTALTGETGAGKSILIDALQLLFGGRSDTGLIRQGSDKSDLTATFSVNSFVDQWLKENEFKNEEADLIIRRTLDVNGKSRSWINGIPCTLSQLKDLSQYLVVVHGQHAHQSLLKKGAQLEMLDAFAQTHPLVEKVKSAWEILKNAQNKLSLSKERQASLSAELERLNWFVDAIKELAPVKDEWNKLNEEHTVLSRHTDTLSACEIARQSLTEADVNALSMIDGAIDAIEDVLGTDPKLEKIYSSLNEAREIIDSASGDVEHFLDRTEFDEERFSWLDKRISLYLELSRKYHVEPEDLFGEWEKALVKVSEMEEEGDVSVLMNKVKEAEEKYFELAKSLSKTRHESALLMSEKITTEMQSLAMEGGSFEVSLTTLEEPGASGIDNCEFLVAGHPGVPRRPLSKVASGGELARISLAIAVTDTASANVETLIFDEVDTGVGGAVAETVGHLLATLGCHQQVLCVTHLPQVASCALHHLKITKQSDNPLQAPISEVHLLGETERLEEIARMLGGITITDKTRAHAKEMLAKSNFKNKQS